MRVIETQKQSKLTKLFKKLIFFANRAQAQAMLIPVAPPKTMATLFKMLIHNRPEARPRVISDNLIS